MEPVSLLLATGAIAVYAAHRAEKMSEKARRGPATLPEMMKTAMVDDAAAVLVLAVHIRTARVPAQLAGETFKVRVKYGEPGASIHCDTSSVQAVSAPRSPAASFVARLRDPSRAREPATVDFGTTCLFLGHRQGESVIRVRLLRSGFFGKTLGRAEIRLPYHFLHSAVIEHRELLLIGTRPGGGEDILGALDAVVEMRAVPKGNLRQHLQLLGAQQQHEAFLMGATPVAQGEVGSVHEDDSAVSPGDILAGEVVSSSHYRGAAWNWWRRRKWRSA